MCRHLLLVVLFACGGGSGAAVVDASQAGDDAPPPSVDGAPDALTCTGSEPMCNGVCVDLANDPMHCGSCTTVCTGSLGACYAQTCVPKLTTEWQVHFGSGSFPGFWFSGVTTDAAGNIYVVGTMNHTVDLGGGPLTIAGGGGSGDILVASFTTGGAHRWSRVFGSAALDTGDRLVLVGTTLYVTGSFTNSIDFGGGALVSAGRTDVFVLGLTAATGAYVSAQRYGNADYDDAGSIAADASGNVIIGGTSGLGAIDFGGGPFYGGGYVNGFLAAFSPTGAHLWSKRLALMSAGTQSSTVTALATDAQGNVYATGSFKGIADFGTGAKTSADNDVYVSSYTNTGTLRWVRAMGGAAYDYGHAIAVSGTSVYAGGLFTGSVDFGLGAVASAGTSDGFLLALNAATGAPRFAHALGSSKDAAIYGLDVAADGNVLATGVVDGTADFGLGPTAALGSFEIFLASLASTDGASRWGKRYGGLEYEGGMAIASGPSGEILVGGQTFSDQTDLGTGPFTLAGTADNGFLMKVVP